MCRLMSCWVLAYMMDWAIGFYCYEEGYGSFCLVIPYCYSWDLDISSTLSSSGSYFYSALDILGFTSFPSLFLSSIS